MQLGIGSYAFAWAIGAPGRMPRRPLTAFGLIDRAARLGVRLVQICDNVPLTEFDLGELDRLAAHAGRRGVRIEVGARGLTLDNVRRHLAVARRLGADLLRVVIDAGRFRPYVAQVVRTLRALAGELADRGVTLAVENHDRFPAATFADIVRRADSPHVGICLDTANSFGAMEGPSVVLPALAPRTVSLHVKDFRIRRADHQMGFLVEGTPAGQGQLDLPMLLRHLRRAGRSPNAILELWPPPLASLQRTIAREARWVKQSVAFLRGFIRG